MRSEEPHQLTLRSPHGSGRCSADFTPEFLHHVAPSFLTKPPKVRSCAGTGCRAWRAHCPVSFRVTAHCSHFSGFSSLILKVIFLLSYSLPEPHKSCPKGCYSFPLDMALYFKHYILNIAFSFGYIKARVLSYMSNITLLIFIFKLLLTLILHLHTGNSRFQISLSGREGLDLLQDYLLKYEI